MAVATVTYVNPYTKPMNLFTDVARLIAFPRMQVLNTSEGINHDNGPIPKLKKIQ